ncbi:MAG: DUF4157 domain-containing protein [Candidatus Nitricoxidivorans perseverans]|uniref:DUF4157 domain-containing protein n=1 Tax=Candidatus Nitricoxidivorans perseverans TaxID=2975601 RepID=A0AA49FJM0_9PROT|nr:MAG: DUF4157 domain-containing protein [Candidatus Nitricoxidivorans perseverans]
MAERAYAARQEGAAARPWLQRKPTLRIGAPDDAYEREADRAADAVASGRGLPQAGLSLSRVPVTQVQREDKPKTEEEKLKEAAQKVGEAFLETEIGKKLKEKAEQDPLVKGAKEAGESFIGTLPGKVITGAAAAGAVAALAATHKELPAQIPEIPLDKIAPGLKVQITYEGPVDNPTKAMITFSYTEQISGEKKPAKPGADALAQDMARFRAGMRYMPGTPAARQQEAEEAAWRRAAFSGVGRLPFERIETFPALAPTSSALPLRFPTPSYGYKPKPFSLLDEELKLKPASESSAAQEQKKKEEGATVQRKAAGGSTRDGAPELVNDVLAESGRPLDAATRGLMEARFGRDFGNVRIHTDARAARSAGAVEALAYTSGTDIVFANGSYEPHSHEGKHLLAHELTHVVQQTGGIVKSAPVLQRATVAESAWRTFRDILFFVPSLFGAELTYSDDELIEYLNGITKENKIQGGYYSDDKARQVVRKWKAGKPEFKLQTRQKVLLILEMQDGIVTAGDRQNIMLLLTDLSTKNVPLGEVFGSGAANYNALSNDLRKAPYREQFAALFTPWLLNQFFAAGERPLAGRILRDLLAITEDELHFADLAELRTEIFKRMRTSQLMRESQSAQAFDYPENMKAGDCPDYDATNQMKNARVNAAARPYWSDVVLDSGLIYYFRLTPHGKQHGFEALTKLFTPQGPGRQKPEDPDPNICKKTLIHCDYLVNVIHYRTFAETIGQTKFDRLVKDGAIEMWLTYTGFPDPNVEDWRKSPKALSVREMRPASEKDLAIGDHVIFWNHLGYDGLNEKFHGAWRLENAVLVDVNAQGNDLFQGHGTAERTHDQMRKELADAYNPLANAALNIARDVKDDLLPMSVLTSRFPNVQPKGDEWVIVDPGVGGDSVRRGNKYKLRTVTDWVNDPDMPGLRDPHDRGKMFPVKRPLESAAQAPPKV